MARFDLAILLQQRGILGERDAHGAATRTRNGWPPSLDLIPAKAVVASDRVRNGPARILK